MMLFLGNVNFHFLTSVNEAFERPVFVNCCFHGYKESENSLKVVS